MEIVKYETYQDEFKSIMKGYLTDYAIINGAHILNYYSSKLDERRGIYFRGQSFYGIECEYIEDENEMNYTSNSNTSVGRRIMYKLDKKDVINVFTNSVVKEGFDKFLVLEYGIYPQMAASKEMQTILNNEFKEGKLQSSNFNYRYCVNDNVYAYSTYKYNDKLYICTKVYLDRLSKVMLSNGQTYKNDDMVWIEVSPLKFYYLDDKKVMVSDKIIIAGFFLKNNLVEEYINQDIVDSNYLLNGKYITGIQKVKEGAQVLGNFRINEDAKKLIIPSTVTKIIGKFYDSSSKNEDFIFKTFDCEFVFEENSQLKEIGEKAFHRECHLEFKKIIFPSSLEKIGKKAFENCTVRYLEFQSSLFRTAIYEEGDIKVRENILRDSIGLDCNSKVKVYGVDIAKEDNKVLKLTDIQRKECRDIITFMLNKFNLKYDTYYFNPRLDEIIDILRINENNIKQKICNKIVQEVYKYLCLKKVYLGFKFKKVIINNLNDLFYEFYKEGKPLDNEYLVIPVKNNPYQDKSIKEVLEMITNYKFEKIDINNFMGFVEYGDELTNYLSYCADKISLIMKDKDSYYQRQEKFINTLNHYREDDIKIDNNLVLSISDFTLDNSAYLKEEMSKLKLINNILKIYFEKINELIAILNQEIKMPNTSDEALYNSVRIDKQENLNNMLQSVVKQYEIVNNMVASNNKLSIRLRNINDNLLPDLVLNYNNGLNSDKEVISQIYKLFTSEENVKKVKKVRR